MGTVTIGSARNYLRLSPATFLGTPPKDRLRFLQADLVLDEVKASHVVDLLFEFDGLVPFFDDLAEHCRDWDYDHRSTWGTKSDLQLEARRGPSPADEPAYPFLSVTLRNRGWHEQGWTITTALLVPPDQLPAIPRAIEAL